MCSFWRQSDLKCQFSNKAVCLYVLSWNWKVNDVSYGSMGCRVFKRGVQNWKDFCLKINIPKGNYRILRNGVMGRCQKVTRFDIHSQFSMSKIIGIFLIFFSLKNINLGAHFLLLIFFDKINFLNHFITKMMPYF